MSQAPRRILILGATGMLGHEVARLLIEDFAVTSAVRDPDRAHQHLVAGDVTPFDAYRQHPDELIDRVRPDAVINAVGLIKQLPDGQRPSAAIRINSLFPHDLASSCVERDVRLIHISTDCVFSGELPAPERYTESQFPDPRDVYGRTKLLGEVVDAPCLTLRTSIIGWELDRASGLLEWFAAQAGGEVGGFTNAMFSGVTTYELAQVIRSVLLEHRDLFGLWHVASVPISKHDLLLCLRDKLGLDSRIVPRSEPVINRALDASRFQSATGYRPREWAWLAEEYAARPR